MSNSMSSLSQPLEDVIIVPAEPIVKADDPIYTSALRQDKNEVRLITLLPDRKDEDIHIMLNVVSLDERPQFEALSYVWGDPKVILEIKLNGIRFWVTKNLYHALKALRRVDEPRIFWIDAVFVNQNDIAERQYQVSLMVQIYSTCQVCTVWLGEEFPDTGKVFEFLRWASHDDNFNNWVANRKPTEDGYSLELPLGYEQGITEALIQLSQASWWLRSWIVQELVLSPVVTVKCGSHEADWNTTIRDWPEMSTNYIYNETTPSQALSNSQAMADVEAMMKFNTAVRHLRGAWYDYRNKSESPDILRLLHRHCHLEATDPRDKVYAFLSLCSSDVQQNIGADYGATLAECYARPTIYDIQETQSLRSLNIVKSVNRAPSLPSWVVDWSKHPAEKTFQQQRLGRYSSFSTAGSVGVSYVQRGHILSLRGIKYDAVLHSGRYMKFYSEGDIDSDKYMEWLRFILRERFPKSKSLDEDIEQRKAMIPFLRTLLRDHFSNPGEELESPNGVRCATADHYNAMCIWLRGKYPDYSTTEKLDKQVENAFKESASYARLFTTRNLSDGIGPMGLEVGDEIWIVCGGNQPLILRLNKNNTDFEGIPSGFEKSYILIGGDCYVDGIMGGEAATNLERDAVDVHLV
ncbi:hypothetical protein VTL71DRAFT_131 [Oculimacula yallundae]|uniref:Heterokaryon incompatibility domain-containing protein n=1 Tax=Oculimacula yallundae TaxID=86028 RepID=A0ABR4CZ79_9HELO